MKKLLLALAVGLPMGALAQAAPPPRAQAEIDHLLGYISQSPCRFNRNGSWHDMAAAREHMTTKYEYLRARGQVDSAEAFIDNAASRSSMSGTDYKVECPGFPATPSGAWLRAELSRYRAAAPASVAAVPGPVNQVTGRRVP